MFYCVFSVSLKLRKFFVLNSLHARGVALNFHDAVYMSYFQLLVVLLQIQRLYVFVIVTKTLIGEPIQTRNVTDCTEDNGCFGVQNPCHVR
jgi:hypothetical protein